MKHSFSLSALTLAAIFSSFGVLAFASKNTNSTASLEPNVSGPSDIDPTTTSTRLLQITDEITGAFDVVVLAKFNDLAGGWYQRVFDFGNGPGKDNVWLGQVGSSSDMAFGICGKKEWTRCTAKNVIIQGELATWKAGVNSDGLQWLEKNGNRVCSIQGQVPRNVVRVNKRIGYSSWWWLDTPLKGAVLGIDITNAGESRDGRLLNKPDQIRGPFDITVQARFDAPQGGRWQRVFDFGNGAGRDNIILGQLENTNDMIFEIWKNDKIYRLVAPKSIVTGLLETWRVGVDRNGLMWMEKMGNRIAQIQGVVPAVIQRNSNLVGSSNWDNDGNLDGVVLGLSVMNSVATLKPTRAPTKAPSKSPTKAPLKPPTLAPTKAPSKSPTKAPLKPPTLAPLKPIRGPTVASHDSKVEGITSNCMEDNWKASGKKTNLVCTAKEVSLMNLKASVRSTCIIGQSLTLSLNGNIKFNTARYDPVWFIAKDGGNALTGKCFVQPLLEGNLTSLDLFDAVGSVKKVGQIEWTKDAKGANDACGDIIMNSGGGGVLQNVDIAKDVTLICDDKNRDGVLDVGICFSWREAGADDTCQVQMVFPGAPSKCFCNRYDIPQITITQNDDPVDECH